MRVAEYGVLPAPGGCEDAVVPLDDPRCPADVMHAAAMSWLGKTTAVFDGVHLELLEYDPEQVRAEAAADATFRRLLAEADASPADGRLDDIEARVLEQRVLDLIDARYALR